MALSQTKALSAPAGARLTISQHGDAFKRDALAALPPQIRAALMALQRARPPGPRGDIVICHSEPGAWALPQPLFQTTLCPPPRSGAGSRGGLAPLFTIGRTMFETDRITAEHARRCNLMSEIWVPTAFHVGTFSASGVDPKKLVVMPEPVDTTFFDPAAPGLAPAALPAGKQVFGPPLKRGGDARGEVVWFLSIFKWEARKGWDVLLEAFCRAFDGRDDVALLMHTNPYHGADDFPQQMGAFAREKGLGGGGEGGKKGGLPRVFVLSEHLSDNQLRRLYAAAAAFVLPSRGEVSGRGAGEGERSVTLRSTDD